MDYGKLLKQAYRNTLKHKSMWLLGLFIVTSGGSVNIPFPDDTDIGQWVNSNSGYQESFSDDVFSANPTVDVWQTVFVDFWYIWVLAGLLVLALVIFHFVMHYVAISGMYYGAEQARLGKTAKFMEMVKYGLKPFWKVLGINILIGLVVMIPVVIIVGIVVGLAFINELFLFGLLLLIPLGLLSIPVFFVFGIVMNYALQYIALRQKGIVESIKLGWQMFKTNIGTSLLVYAIMIGVGIAFGLAFFALLLIIIIPFAIIGFVAYGALGSAAGAITAIITMFVGGSVLLCVGLLFKGVKLSFVYHTWHLVFAELEQSVKSDSVKQKPKQEPKKKPTTQSKQETKE